MTDIEHTFKAYLALSELQGSDSRGSGFAVTVPKVIPDKSVEFDLNRECEAALSRLSVSIEANANYQIKLLKKQSTFLKIKDNLGFSNDRIIFKQKPLLTEPLYFAGVGGSGGGGHTMDTRDGAVWLFHEPKPPFNSILYIQP